MINILTYIENILKIITAIFGMNGNKEIENFKNQIDFNKDEHVFIASIIIGFILGIFFSYIKK